MKKVIVTSTATGVTIASDCGDKALILVQRPNGLVRVCRDIDDLIWRGFNVTVRVTGDTIKFTATAAARKQTFDIAVEVSADDVKCLRSLLKTACVTGFQFFL